MGKPWPKVKRARCLRRMKDLMPKMGWKLTLERVADEQDVPESTLSWWWQLDKKEAKVRAQANEVEAPAEMGRGVRVSCEKPGSEVAHSSRLQPQSPAAPPPPRKPYLLIDGVLRCSRCKSEQLEEREGKTFYCLICNVLLEFEGFCSERTQAYYTLGKDSWML